MVEVLIVIAIIAILSTIIVIAFTNAQVKARDSWRRADVQTISNALQAYHRDTKEWVIHGVGTTNDERYTGWISGAGGTGTGYFNLTGPGNTDSYAKKSIADALVERKFLIQELRDPRMISGNYSDTVDPSTYEYFTYVVYECPCESSLCDLLFRGKILDRKGLVVYAKVENETQQDTESMAEVVNGPGRCNVANPGSGHLNMDYVTEIK